MLSDGLSDEVVIQFSGIAKILLFFICGYFDHGWLLIRQPETGSFFCLLSSDICHLNGGVAQLGERLPCTQEVIGSIPFTSTNQRTEDRPLQAGTDFPAGRLRFDLSFQLFENLNQDVSLNFFVESIFDN